MRILAIETSCDETAAAVVEDGRTILSNVVSTQAAIHAPYGGVVPELASRHHLENVVPVIDQAMKGAALGFADLDAVAVTQGPGLIGSLMVGVQAAKGIAFVHDKPLIPVHHIAGHIQAPFLAHGDIPLPALALVVSGGHTHLYEVPREGRYEMLGRTRDDAAGEAFDKVAKLLGLGYPGGPVIDRLARGAKVPPRGQSLRPPTQPRQPPVASHGFVGVPAATRQPRRQAPRVSREPSATARPAPWRPARSRR